MHCKDYGLIFIEDNINFVNAAIQYAWSIYTITEIKYFKNCFQQLTMVNMFNTSAEWPTNHSSHTRAIKGVRKLMVQTLTVGINI